MARRATILASAKALGWCGCAALGASFLIASCSNSSSGGAPDESKGESADDGEILLDLKSVKGRIEVSSEASGDGCTSSTTSSVIELSAGDETTDAATFERGLGHFSLGAMINVTQLPVEGSVTCGSDLEECSGSSSPFTLPTFAFSDSLLEGVVPSVPSAAPDEFAFFVNFPLPLLPKLCRGEEYAEEEAHVVHLGPVSVAQLEAGRFKLSSKGSKPIHPVPLDDDDLGIEHTLDGTLSWDIELELEASNVAVSDVDPPNGDGVSWYDQCTTATAAGPENLTAETEQAIEDGAESVDLDGEGCFQRHMTVDGDTTTVEMVQVTGADVTFNDKTKLLESTPKEEILFRSTFEPGSWRSTLYENGQPYYERADEWDDAGSYLNGTATEHQPEGAAERWVSTPVDDDTLTVVHDTLLNGDVTSTEQWTQAIAQAKGPAAAECVKPVKCNSAALKSLLKKLWNGKNGKGAECMKRVAPNAARQIGALVSAGSFDVVCGDMSACPSQASFTVPGQKGFVVYLADSLSSSLTAADITAIGGRSLDLSRASQAAFEMAVTLFHESLHSLPTFAHNSDDDPYLGNAKNKDLAHRFSRAYACEVTCFAPDMATACNCRRCAIPEGNNGKGRTCPACDNYPAADCSLYACSADKTLFETAAACKTDCGGIACKNRSVPECLPSE